MDYPKETDDRAPTLEEIKKIIEYPDRRIRPVVYTMASSGIRVGAWDYLKWHHIHPIVRDGKLIAAKMIVYAEENDEYFSFITAEAYSSLKSWIDYREKCGEKVTRDSWVMRNLWDATKPREKGVITEPRKLTSIGIKRLVERALWAQGVRNTLQVGKKRHEFQTDHGFRKWFRTRCELAGMKLSNIETLTNHSLGISDSYYRITERELLDDYLKAINFLIIDDQQKLQKQLAELTEKNKKQSSDAVTRLQERDKDIAELQAAVEFLKNKMNAALISRPSTEVISDEKGIPRAIESNEICNTAVAEVSSENSG